MKLYDTRNLKGDLSGGMVAGIIALPLALAFGVQSGLGAAAGLYGAITLGVLAAALGGTATQASGPTGPMTVVSASIVAMGIERAGSVEAGMGIILLAFMLGGLFQIALGFLGVGKYIRYFPYPVISGFMSGVGLIIITLQVWPFLGSASPKTTLDVFTQISTPLSQITTNIVSINIVECIIRTGITSISCPIIVKIALVGVGNMLAIVNVIWCSVIIFIA